jgi:hypothetical protein
MKIFINIGILNYTSCVRRKDVQATAVTAQEVAKQNFCGNILEK